MKEIPLTQGFVALVDDEDYDRVAAHRWCVCKKRSNYAMRKVRVAKGRDVTVYMHRVITNTPDGSPVDHVNGDGLDNRKSNLRLSSPAHNSHNRRPAGTSRFRGVSLHESGKWVAQAALDGSPRYLGIYDTEEEAARAYDSAVLAYWGSSFAALNFPETATVDDIREIGHVCRCDGERLRALRRSAGLSLERLSERAGVNMSHLHKVEKGQKATTERWLARVAVVLNVQAHDLRAEVA